jgi:hypothetical protein
MPKYAIWNLRMADLRRDEDNGKTLTRKILFHNYSTVIDESVKTSTVLSHELRIQSP